MDFLTALKSGKRLRPKTGTFNFFNISQMMVRDFNRDATGRLLVSHILGEWELEPDDECDHEPTEDKSSEAAKDLVASGVSFTRIDPAMVFKTTAGDLNVTSDPALPPDQIFYESKTECNHKWVPYRRRDFQNCRVCELCGEREIR